MGKETSTKEVAEIIVKAIREEPFFSEDILIPKITAMIKAFRLRISSIEYNSIKSSSQTARLIRAIEINNFELSFWKEQLKEIVGIEKMDEYYAKLDEKRLIWNQG